MTRFWSTGCASGREDSSLGHADHPGRGTPPDRQEPAPGPARGRIRARRRAGTPRSVRANSAFLRTDHGIMPARRRTPTLPCVAHGASRWTTLRPEDLPGRAGVSPAMPMNWARPAARRLGVRGRDRTSGLLRPGARPQVQLSRALRIRAALSQTRVAARGYHRCVARPGGRS